LRILATYILVAAIAAAILTTREPGMIVPALILWIEGAIALFLSLKKGSL
jgi:hypothetical protein